MNMVIGKIKHWWAMRKLSRAQAVINSYGLSVVKLKEVAGTTYLINPNGVHLKLSKWDSTAVITSRARAFCKGNV